MRSHMVISQLTSGVAPPRRNGTETRNVSSIALQKSRRCVSAPTRWNVCEVTSFMCVLFGYHLVDDVTRLDVGAASGVVGGLALAKGNPITLERILKSE